MMALEQLMQSAMYHCPSTDQKELTSNLRGRLVRQHSELLHPSYFISAALLYILKSKYFKFN
jgi:hypothetical protein